MPNVLDQLQEVSFKGITFPTTRVKLTLSHDLAQHKYWGVDGAHIEATGRAPLVFHVSIPFRNNLTKAAVESWGTLYPDVYRSFMDAAAQKSTGVFIHPEFGPYNVKCADVQSDIDPNKRDGQDVEATFIETVVPNDTAPTFAFDSPVASSMAAAKDLDSALSTLLTPPPTSGVYQPNFFESLRQIAGIGDQISLLNKQIAGKISQLVYRVQAIQSSFASLAQARLWPVQDSCDRLNNSLYQLQQRLLQNQQSVSFYIVPQRTTLGALANDLGAKAADLIKLNPSLVSLSYVPAKTVVRYYGS